MMKYIVTAAVFLVTLFSLISCDQGPKQSTDGYKFEKETFTRTDIDVKVVLVKDQTEMNVLLKEKGRKVAAGNEVAAFATLAVNEPRCTIYMIDPKNKYEPEFIGHEFVHCVYGDWHPSQP
jgi:hypothetical protein